MVEIVWLLKNTCDCNNVIPNDQRLFWLSAQPMRDVVTMQHSLSLAEPVAQMIPDAMSQIFPQQNTPSPKST